MIEIVINAVCKPIEIIGKNTNRLLQKIGKTNVEGMEFDLKTDSYTLKKIHNFLNPKNFSVGKLLFLIFLIYIFIGIFSRVPILYPSSLAFGIGLIFLSVIVFLGGEKACKIKKVKKYRVNYDLWTGFLVIGLIGLIANYMSIGMPLFNPDLKSYYHNVTWSISMIFYILGMTITLTKYKQGSIFWLFLIISLFLAIGSGFVTDLILFIFPIITLSYLKGKRKNNLIFIILLFLFFAIIIKSSLSIVNFNGVNYSPLNITSRFGFTLYVLSILVRNVGLAGLTHGQLFLNTFFLQFLGVPITFFGDVVSEMVVGMPRSHSSTFVGPLYLEFGILGVIIIPFILGFFCELPKKIYSLSKNNFFLALYSINLSILLVWIETGPIQYYLVFLFFVMGIWCLKWLKRS